MEKYEPGKGLTGLWQAECEYQINGNKHVLASRPISRAEAESKRDCWARTLREAQTSRDGWLVLSPPHADATGSTFLAAGLEQWFVEVYGPFGARQ